MKTRWFFLFANLFRQGSRDRELDDEIQGFQEMLADEKIAAGMDPAEARRQALLEIEGQTQVKEKVRQARTGALLLSILQDLRYAARLLIRRPAFTLSALLTLAIGIGVNTAIFSVVHAVLLEPLPYERPQDLVLVWSVFPGAGLSRAPASGPELDEIRKRSTLFQGLAGIWVGRGSLIGEGEPEQVKLGQVTANFFSVLGVKPALGRNFTPEEEGGRGAPAVMLSDGLWRRRFGADPQIAGKTIRIPEGKLVVAGVMPRDFELIFPADANVPADVQAWMPFPYPIEKNPRDLNFVRVLGRLAKGVSVDQAQAELTAIARDLRAQFPEYAEQQLGLHALPLHHDAVKEASSPILFLWAGVALVLLIACANVASLLLARAGERSREMIMRSTLGATRSRVIRQLLTESMLLAGVAGFIGVLLARFLVKLMFVLWPDAAPRLGLAEINAPVLLFTLALSFVTGLIFGLAPALSASKADLLPGLKQTARNLMPGGFRARRFLLAGEVGLAFVLLMGEGLMLQTFVRLLHADPGFNPHQVLTFSVTLPQVRYPDDIKRLAFLRELEEKLAALREVQAAGSVSHLPFGDFPNWYSPYWPQGAPTEQQNTMMADHRSVSPGFFNVLKVAFVAGRGFTATDDATHPLVAIVDDSLALQTWPGQDPVGKKINVEVIHNGNFVRDWAEVVGVVRHVKYHSLMRQVRGQIYLPSAQSPRPQMQMSFVMRSAAAPQALAEPVRSAVRELDKELPVSRLRPLDDYVASAQVRTRFTSVLAALLGTVAFLLAFVGIYGVTAYSVVQRTSEIGVRLALGAGRTDIMTAVLRQGLLPVLAGILLGALGSFVLTPLLAGLLFEVKPLDPLAVFGSAVVLGGGGFLACYLPARRASRMDPVVALRYE